MSLITKVEGFAQRWGWARLAGALGASVLLGAAGLTWATVLYVRSGFPPMLIEGQLAFSAEATRGWYAVLLEKGTLGIYARTQLVDYLFIFGLMSALFFLHVMIAKAQPNPGWRRVALWFAILGPTIAASDAVENIVTLTMLSRPTDFPPALAILASSISAVKWGWAVIGCSMIVVQLVALAVVRLRRAGAAG